MTTYTYTVAPFMGILKSGGNAGEVSSQLEQLINEYAAKGWEFYQLSDVNIEVKPGCIGGLLGRESDYVVYDQAIFRRMVT